MNQIIKNLFANQKGTVATLCITGMMFFAASGCKEKDSGGVITIDTQPATTTIVTKGNISGSLSVLASVTKGATLSYQWYRNAASGNTDGTPILNATDANFIIPARLATGTYYYFCEVRATGVGRETSVRSAVATVNVVFDIAVCKDVEIPLSEFYYTDTGSKENFTVRKDKVVVKTNSEAETKALMEQSVFLTPVYLADWLIATIDSSTTDLCDLMQIAGVADAAYGLEYWTEAIIYPKNIIYMKCKEGQTPETVLDYNGLTAYIETIELYNPRSGLYRITFHVPLGDILRICCDLYESGLCSIAGPSFMWTSPMGY